MLLPTTLSAIQYYIETFLPLVQSQVQCSATETMTIKKKKKKARENRETKVRRKDRKRGTTTSIPWICIEQRRRLVRG